MPCLMIRSRSKIVSPSLWIVASILIPFRLLNQSPFQAVPPPTRRRRSIGRKPPTAFPEKTKPAILTLKGSASKPATAEFAKQMLHMPRIVHSPPRLAADASQMAKADDDFHFKSPLTGFIVAPPNCLGVRLRGFQAPCFWKSKALIDERPKRLRRAPTIPLSVRSSSESGAIGHLIQDVENPQGSFLRRPVSLP
jgi:hypothetical protein